ncbi:hypothetical protein OH76DRAFT_1475686 [Lentinus brumalis]|uniref:Uncharacterized protein n=1 Tax=Lentinus brumalis TaxID=2498619 RepID=A0A371CN53_9APHY|nr:hypothetical protein OH76DRAFT_1475686 [Polyporus brumalis]
MDKRSDGDGDSDGHGLVHGDGGSTSAGTRGENRRTGWETSGAVRGAPSTLRTDSVRTAHGGHCRSRDQSREAVPSRQDAREDDPGCSRVQSTYERSPSANGHGWSRSLRPVLLPEHITSAEAVGERTCGLGAAYVWTACCTMLRSELRWLGDPTRLDSVLTFALSRSVVVVRPTTRQWSNWREKGRMKTYHTVGEENGEGRGEERMERRDGTTRAEGGGVWERHCPDTALGSRFDVRNAAAALAGFDVCPSETRMRRARGGDLGVRVTQRSGGPAGTSGADTADCPGEVHA